MSRKLTTSLLLLTLMGSLAGCAGMSRSERNTVAGAAIGGVAGSVLTDGSALGTVGGAAIGGLIGIILAGMPGSPIRRLVVNDIGPYVASTGLVRTSSKILLATCAVEINTFWPETT